MWQPLSGLLGRFSSGRSRIRSPVSQTDDDAHPVPYYFSDTGSPLGPPPRYIGQDTAHSPYTYDGHNYHYALRPGPTEPSSSRLPPAVDPIPPVSIPLIRDVGYSGSRGHTARFNAFDQSIPREDGRWGYDVHGNQVYLGGATGIEEVEEDVDERLLLANQSHAEVSVPEGPAADGTTGSDPFGEFAETIPVDPEHVPPAPDMRRRRRLRSLTPFTPPTMPGSPYMSPRISATPYVPPRMSTFSIPQARSGWSVENSFYARDDSAGPSYAAHSLTGDDGLTYPSFHGFEQDAFGYGEYAVHTDRHSTNSRNGGPEHNLAPQSSMGASTVDRREGPTVLQGPPPPPPSPPPSPPVLLDSNSPSSDFTTTSDTDFDTNPTSTNDILSTPVQLTTSGSERRPVDARSERALIQTNLASLKDSMSDIQSMSVNFSNLIQHYPSLEGHVEACRRLEKSLLSVENSLTQLTLIGEEHWQLRSLRWQDRNYHHLLSLQRNLQKLRAIEQILTHRHQHPSQEQWNRILTKLEQHNAKLLDLASKFDGALDRLKVRHLHSMLCDAHEKARKMQEARQLDRVAFKQKWSEGKAIRSHLRHQYNKYRTGKYPAAM